MSQYQSVRYLSPKWTISSDSSQIVHSSSNFSETNESHNASIVWQSRREPTSSTSSATARTVETGESTPKSHFSQCSGWRNPSLCHGTLWLRQVQGRRRKRRWRIRLQSLIFVDEDEWDPSYEAPSITPNISFCAVLGVEYKLFALSSWSAWSVTWFVRWSF